MNKRQKDIYDFIKNFLNEYNYSPSMREITTAVGLKSVSTTHGHLERLRNKGYIDFINSLPRTLQIVR
ncbi:hypothetical protein MPH47_19575 [Psychrobacillus psychrodurans]|uniref:LexA family protein n=1 Tax=Psychrobacillus psychrodurans TaxID=126157 RepID=UPI001F4ECEF1|nr:hypothetical protein [Psychrobacillus psychrodurans]MCK1999398.1 hypothetical protein [Psychrobacillus psychrodurans]